MPRIGPILLACCFAFLGSGGLESLHNLDHAARDAARADVGHDAGHHAAHDDASGHDGHGHHHHDADPPPTGHRHDETNCTIHAQLHTPLLAAGRAPVLVCLGVFVAFLSLLSPRLTPQRVPPRTDCRGPPAC